MKNAVLADMTHEILKLESPQETHFCKLNLQKDNLLDKQNCVGQSIKIVVTVCVSQPANSLWINKTVLAKTVLANQNCVGVCDSQLANQKQL